MDATEFSTSKLTQPQRTLSAPMLTPSELHFLGLADEIHSQGMPQRSLPRTASVHEFGQYGALLRKFSKRPSSKLERFIYKKRGKVLGMDFVEGGCRSRGSWAVSKASSGRKQQKRREVQSLARDWRREGWEVANWSRGGWWVYIRFTALIRYHRNLRQPYP